MDSPGMLSTHLPSPSPPLSLEESSTDDGFMVVPVWDPVQEVQIGSVVWEDPFIGFGSAPIGAPSAPLSAPKEEARSGLRAPAAAAADAAFVGSNHYQEPYASQPAQPPFYPPQPPPQQQQQPHFLFHQPNPEPQPELSQPTYAPPPQEPQPNDTNWWEESMPMSEVLEALEGNNDDFLGLLGNLEPERAPASAPVPTRPAPPPAVAPPPVPMSQSQVRCSAAITYPPPPEPSANARPPPEYRSPQEVLNEIYQEATALESEGSQGGADSDDLWSSSPTDSFSAPSPMDDDDEDTVLAIPVDSLPERVRRKAAAGRKLNVVLQLKDEDEPDSGLSQGLGHSRHRGPKLRATVLLDGGVTKKGRSGGRKKQTKNGDTKERKKEQNRVAATRYREKKRSAREILLKELEDEEVRHAALKKKEEDAVAEITYLKDLLKKIKAKALP